MKWQRGLFGLSLTFLAALASCGGGASPANGAGTAGRNGNAGGAGQGGWVPSDGGADGGGAPGSDASGDMSPDGTTGVIPCSPPTDKDKPIEKLTQTGCVDPTNPKQMAAIVVPYDVNSPLWSDGALKTRGMVIPAGKKIHVKDCAKNPDECCVHDPNNFSQCLPPVDDGKWEFPVGSVLVKNFLFNNDPNDVTTQNATFVETRLFVHFDENTWVGYGYRWNDTQTEATIVPNDRVKVAFNTGNRTVEWNYPSRADCVKCHDPSGGSTLGLETAQLNRIVGGMNQIDRIQALGLFEFAPAKPYKAALVAPYPGQAGNPPATATLDDKARSYIHANCSFCHRPDGAFYTMDLRHNVSFAATHVCNQMPDKGGPPGATNLTPGNPMLSMMWLRMLAPAGDASRMPQIGTSVIDVDGAKLISDWITSIKSCPM